MRFDAFEVALEIVRCAHLVLEELRPKDPDLARQGERALSSIPLNVAEGNRRRGGDRIHSFNIAAGSADELVAAMRTAEAKGKLSAERIAETLALCDRELAMLYRLTH